MSELEPQLDQGEIERIIKVFAYVLSRFVIVKDFPTKGQDLILRRDDVVNACSVFDYTASEEAYDDAASALLLAAIDPTLN